MKNFKFKHYDTRNKEWIYSDNLETDGCFYVNTKGVLFLYGYRNKKNEYKEYKSYNVKIHIGKDRDQKDVYSDDTVRHGTYGVGIVKYCSEELGFYIDFGGEDWDMHIKQLQNCELITE